MAQKVQLTLSDEALKVIGAHATERKRGEFVSTILLDYARITGDISSLDNDADGILERIDRRLGRIEKQLGLLLSECHH